MNKIIKYCFLLATLVIGLTACNDDNSLPSSGPVVHPEQECQGTFSGTWTITKQVDTATPVVNEYSGTVQLKDSGKAYITTVIFSCPDDGNFDVTNNANIIFNAEGYKFFAEGLNSTNVYEFLKARVKAENPTLTDDKFTFAGGTFIGQVTENGQLTVSFSFDSVVTNGRKKITTNYNYSFTGNK